MLTCAYIIVLDTPVRPRPHRPLPRAPAAPVFRLPSSRHHSMFRRHLERSLLSSDAKRSVFLNSVLCF